MLHFKSSCCRLGPLLAVQIPGLRSMVTGTFQNWKLGYKSWSQSCALGSLHVIYQAKELQSLFLGYTSSSNATDVVTWLCIKSRSYRPRYLVTHKVPTLQTWLHGGYTSSSNATDVVTWLYIKSRCYRPRYLVTPKTVEFSLVTHPESAVIAVPVWHVSISQRWQGVRSLFANVPQH